MAAMTGNPLFPSPLPSMAEASAMVADYEAAVADFLAKSQALRLAMSIKESKREALQALLTGLAGYVQAATAGDASGILSSGMQVRSGVAPVGDLAAPGDLSARVGENEGEVFLVWRRLSGARSYEVEWATQEHREARKWQRAGVVTAAKLRVTGLTPGGVFVFRVRAIGAAGAGAWSDEAVRRAP